MKNRFLKLMSACVLLTLLCAAFVPMASAEGKIVANTKYYTGTVYAGMKKTYAVYDADGDAQDPTDYKWKSSNTSVATVTARGVVTGKKAGKATITITNRYYSSENYKLTLTVKKNKVDKIYSKPTASSASYKKATCTLKSVEIVSPSKIAVEFYVAFNFPSSWKATKINYVTTAINLYDKSTGSYEKTIVGDSYQAKSTKVTGFKARKGKFVQVIKVIYSGSQVHYTNTRLSNYLIGASTNTQFNYRYTY